MSVIFLVLSIFIIFCTASQAGKPGTGDAGPVSLDSIRVLNLKTAQQIALAGNPSLAAAGERVHQARERVSQARSAYWPRLDLTGSASRVLLSENDYQASLASARRINPLSEVNDREDYYNTGLKLSWTLFNGFERKFSKMSALYGEKESQEARIDSRRLLISSVAAGYYNAQLARENIAIAEANEDYNRRQLEEAEARLRMGTGSLSTVLNFKVQINSAKAEHIKAKQAYEVTMSSLAYLMGIAGATFPAQLELAILETETPEELVLPDSKEQINYAKGHRPDLQQSNHLLKQADSNVRMAKAGFFPTISMSASVDGDRKNDRDFEQEDFGETIGVNLSYNLFAGGYNRAKVREAKARRVETEKRLENLIIAVEADVVSALADLRSAQEQLALQRSNSILVKQNRDLAEKEYTAGQGSLVRLNEAQRDLVTARSRLALALVSMRQAWQGLKVSTAEILIPFAD